MSLTATSERLPGAAIGSVPRQSVAVGGADADPAVFALLDQLAESVLVACPVRDESGGLADFTIAHLSPGYVDPAGRSPAELAGLTLLQAYPESASGDGLFTRAAQVLADGRQQRVSGAVAMPRTGPLTGRADTAQIADLRAAPYAGCVVFTWRSRSAGEDSRLAELLGHVQRLGQLGGWDEDFRTQTIRWTEQAFAIFGLDPGAAIPITMAEMHNYVVSADRPLLRRFRQSLLRQREPAAAMFRVVRPEDGAVRQIRVFAEPVVEDDEVVALRGAFQDVSPLYHTQVALAATRDQLADSEQRAAEEHELAVTLQRAIMPSGTVLGETSGVEIAVRYRPAQAGHLVAGDWYDTIQLPSGDLLIVVGDIAGHGIEAVTGMVTARYAFRGFAATDSEPRSLISQLNFAACLFAEFTGTVVCGCYNPGTRVFRWARAGHLPPVLVRGGVAAVQPMPEGMLLGVEMEAQYEQVELQLRAGDILLLYTDGLIERRAASISDALAEFAAAAVPAGPDLDGYAARILATAGSDTGDDACLVAVRIL